MKKHHYTLQMTWTGNLGKGTKTYTGYSRDHEIKIAGKPTILGSSDPSFRGDPTRYNPEELFLSSLSTCHMLWYLHLCSVNKIILTHYEDMPQGVMVEAEDGSGYFESVTLHPKVRIEDANQVALAKSLHQQAGKYCFIANSVNFKLAYASIVEVG